MHMGGASLATLLLLLASLCCVLHLHAHLSIYLAVVGYAMHVLRYDKLIAASIAPKLIYMSVNYYDIDRGGMLVIYTTSCSLV